MKHPQIVLKVAAATWLVAAGCSGQIHDSAEQTNGTPNTPAVTTPGAPGAAGPATGMGAAGVGGVGTIGGAGSTPSVMPASVGTGVEPLAGPPTRSAGARRLSRQEVERSIQRLVGADVTVDTSVLPADTLSPFDNDILQQSPSMLLVESIESIAKDVATWTTAVPARLARVVPCTPVNATDAKCFEQFLVQFGRRVLRRPLAADEITGMADLLEYAKASGNFADAVKVALRVFFMHPEFLYRVEPGMGAAGGKVRLTAFEVASRLSFLLQGTTPDDALLAAAAAGTLDTPAGLAGEAKRLLAAPEGVDQVRRFHAFWLGYSKLNTLPIEQKLRTETDALVDRATAPGADYRDLLLADDTRVDGELVTHYGLSAAASAFQWVRYDAAPRRGILSHGLFAAAGAKFTDTSPTRRGKFIRERMLCQIVPLPPPGSDIDVDLPPKAKKPDDCKIDRYKQHREDPTCAGCHAFMDPIGFGLENFDELGRYRTHDKGREACVIDGKGALDDSTPFTGAKELAPLIANSPQFEPCVAQHYIRFAAGRALDPEDVRRAQWLGDAMKSNGNAFDAMVLAYITHEDFRLREE